MAEISEYFTHDISMYPKTHYIDIYGNDRQIIKIFCIITV